MPGWKGKQTFIITNDSSSTISYNLNWIEVTNTFNRKQDFIYTLKVIKNGKEQTLVASKSLPSVTSVLASNQTISAKSQNTYILEYEYKNQQLNQDIDQGKKFEGRIQINKIN